MDIHPVSMLCNEQRWEVPLDDVMGNELKYLVQTACTYNEVLRIIMEGEENLIPPWA